MYTKDPANALSVGYVDGNVFFPIIGEASGKKIFTKKMFLASNRFQGNDFTYKGLLKFHAIKYKKYRIVMEKAHLDLGLWDFYITVNLHKKDGTSSQILHKQLFGGGSSEPTSVTLDEFMTYES